MTKPTFRSEPLLSTPRKKLVVSAPSRLHFGLISIGDETERLFGGAGMMIQDPRTEVSFATAESFSVECDESVLKPAQMAARNWFENIADQRIVGSTFESLPVGMTIKHVGRHQGFGSGTQLAFSIAVGMQTFFGLPLPSTAELAQALHRAKRSAIGSFGFFQGGVLVDRGAQKPQHVAELDFRSDFPEQWPILIVSPAVNRENITQLVSGIREQSAFANLAATNQRQADEMMALVKEQIVPGVLEQKFELFAEGVCEFGRRSGQYFAAEQGGTYASQASQEIVDEILDVGIFGVGQSSWGPSLFAIAPSLAQAEVLQSHLADRFPGCCVAITFADNQGVRVS
jgi:beta-RFAP synthase